jgi:hypothetical protein
MNQPLLFVIGDMVIFTNDAGINFGPYTVTGFAEQGEPDSVTRRFYDRGYRYHIDYDCYWFPVKESSLTKIVTFEDEAEELRYAHSGKELVYSHRAL